ncbi:MAG: MFS transporter [Bacteroidetes bacterium]|nr:MAG: MFS transporter [Bacteroidota bacterium]
MTDKQPQGKFPISIPYIMGNEIAERFSFYGMRSILTVFLVAYFFNPTNIASLTTTANAKANELTHLFVTLAYFMPMVGGIAADWFFGKYKVILYVSIFYTIGTIILALSTHNLGFFELGLVVVAIAAGGIKSCVSANVGDQFDKSNQHLLSKMYGWFYVAINTGGTLSPIFIPIFYEKFGPGVAFGVPGILMCIATIVFWLGRKKYVRVPPSGARKENFVSITAYAIQKLFSRKSGQSVWSAVGEKYSAQSIEGVKAVYRILIVFGFTPIYWAMWDQNLSEWILQARNLDLHLGFGVTILAQQINFINPLFVVSLTPVFTYFIFPFFERIGIKPTPLRKIGAGLFLIGICFIVIAMVQQNIDKGGHPSVWWQIFAYVLLAMSEILVSITCLEYAYTHSPPNMKSTMSALYLLGISVGNYFDTLINGSIANNGYFSSLTGASYYWFFIKVLVVFLIIYLFVSKKIVEKNYVQPTA